ncbi:MAG: ABC transporter substrate-binding protein [Solirubrobacteraceae bacterium]
MRQLRLLVAALAAAAALLIAGCGDDGGGSGGGSSGDEGPVTLNVGVIPIADVAPLYLGMDKGFFEKEGLKIVPKLAEGGAAIVPAVLAGDDQIGFSNTTSLIIAASKDLPIQIISQGVLAGESTEQAWDGVVVPKGSDIESITDLEGKTVAVNTLNNVSQIVVNTALEKAGGDPSKVKYVEVPFPDMNAALESGRVDAAFEVEPGYSGGLAAGSRNISNAYEEMAPNYTVATYFTSKQYIAENRDVVDRFARAMQKSLEYAAGHDDEVRAIVGTYTEIPQEVLDKMNLPVWKSDLNQPTIEQTADAALKYGFIEEKPALDELILQDGQ